MFVFLGMKVFIFPSHLDGIFAGLTGFFLLILLLHCVLGYTVSVKNFTVIICSSLCNVSFFPLTAIEILFPFDFQCLSMICLGGFCQTVQYLVFILICVLQVSQISSVVSLFPLENHLPLCLPHSIVLPRSETAGIYTIPQLVGVLFCSPTPTSPYFFLFMFQSGKFLLIYLQVYKSFPQLSSLLISLTKAFINSTIMSYISYFHFILSNSFISAEIPFLFMHALQGRILLSPLIY